MSGADEDLAGRLAPLARLALAYSPGTVREHWIGLLSLDGRLSAVVRTAREPMLAQIRLAWWRDRLTGDPATWPKGEPLLARLKHWGDHARGLSALVDGWEGLLGEEPGLAEFAEGRAAAMATLARLTGADPGAAEAAGRRWALADLVLHLGAPAEKARATGLLAAAAPAPKLGRAMRPLAVMAGLSERAIRRGAGEALSGPGALLSAIRLGISG
jgi:phytoene synthase